MDISKPIRFIEHHRFSVISWGATVLLVVALLGTAFWWTQGGPLPRAARPEPTASPAEQQPSVSLPSEVSGLGSVSGIGRALQLKTSLSSKGTLKPITYKV